MRDSKGLEAIHQELKEFGDDYGLVKRVGDKYAAEGKSQKFFFG